MGSWRWTARLIGFVTIIILARLLIPEDFGIIAIGMLVVTFFEILIDLGTDHYLIRLTAPEREDYDTAWTLRLIVIAAASTLIFLLAAPMAAYFDDDRLTNVLQVLAFASLLRGFTNIGLTMYRRNLQFGKIALIGLTQRLVGSFTTIGFAFLLHSYWAMVLGEIALRATELILSYVFHSYRPRLAFTRFTRQWDFCKWIVVRNLASFLQGNGDQLVVAKYFSIEQIGFYSMAMRFANLPTTQLVAPMLAPVYSGLAKKQDDPAHFAQSVLKLIGATGAIMLPAATLFSTLNEPLVISILGANWQPAAPLVALLVLAIATNVLIQPAVTTLTILGHVKLLAALHWFSAILLIGSMLVVAQLGDLEQLALTRMALAITLLLLYYGWLCSTMGLSWRRLVECLYRPCIASLIMGFVITSITTMSYEPWVTIVLATPAGSATYLILVYGLWRAASSPDSGEALLVRKFSKLFGRQFKRLLK